MKKYLFTMLAVVLGISCAKIESPENGGKKNITFIVENCFVQIPFTKALEADGKSMSDLWVFDYVGNTLMQTIHQTSNDEDFGTPAVSLDYGDHVLYFVASRGTNPTLNTTNGTIVWEKVNDTFYKAYEISVVGKTETSITVALDRTVTKVKVTFTDAIAEGTATLRFTPTLFYYGINYKTGAAVSPAENLPINISVPAGNIGQTGKAASIFTITGTPFNADITIDALKSDETVIGRGIINEALLRPNYSEEYSGPLFTSGGAASITLNSEWNVHQGTW